MKKIVPALMLVVSAIYLLNFTMGVFELPDYLPIVGNLDEAAATLVFVAAMKHFGVDLTEWVLPRKKATSPGKAAYRS